jgi:hypothetical protein
MERKVTDRQTDRQTDGRTVRRRDKEKPEAGRENPGPISSDFSY